MKKPIIIGNWKANKNFDQVKEWIEAFIPNCPRGEMGVEVVLAPAYPYFIVLRHFFQENNLSVKLCAQDISIYPEGAYTGAVAGTMLSGLVEYVIIGHSERRKYFQETDGILEKKVQNALAAGLKPIYCISGEKMIIPKGVEIVAYEPLFAIGSGNPDNPENANKVAGAIKTKHNGPVIYGGSVKSTNVRDFINQPEIDGVLPGGASLDASEFLKIIKNAS